MKKSIFVILFMVAGSLTAQEVEYTKQELVNMMLPELIKSTCTPAILECYELSTDSCKADVEKLVRGSCSSHIPNTLTLTLTDMEPIKNISKKVATCVVGGVIGSRAEQLMKNINTPGCQSLLQ